MKRTLGLLCMLILLGINGISFASPILGGQLYATGGDIQVTVNGGDAGYTSELSLYSPVLKYIATNRDSGTTVDLGSFTAGTELIFGILVRDTGDIFYTGPASRNADVLAHAAVDFLSPGVAVVGFEDLFNGGDKDYNDCIFTFKGALSPNPVPEPATMLLLGSGLVGIAGFSRKLKK